MATQVNSMDRSMGRKHFGWVAFLSLVGAATVAWAHHSTAMYDYTNTITVSGTVKEFQWTNPHMFIKVLVPDAKGVPQEWSIECGTPNINARHGWKRSDIKAGDRLTMEVNPLRDGTAGGTLKSVELADGRKLYGPAHDIIAVPASGVPPAEPGHASQPPSSQPH